jgi:hypothetical protein
MAVQSLSSRLLVKPAIERAFFLLRAGDLRLSDANYLLKQKF